MEDLQLELIIAALINFWILFYIFKRFLWEKLTKAIEERRKFLAASNQAEEDAKIKIEEANKKVEEILEGARNKASDIEKSAEELSKQNASKAKDKAEKEVEHILSSARNQIEKDKLEMENSMRSKILDLSLRLTSKIFSKENANKDFLEKELNVLTK